MTQQSELPRGYVYLQDLGAGAFGDVVLARHTGLDRLVAIKAIHRYALFDEEAFARFRREGRVLAALRHPAIVRVYDFIVKPAGALLVMEYVPGQPLSELLESGALPPGQGMTVLSDVANALTAAAQHGVVHRDVKPANVFVLPDGRAKLGDFGLARVVSDPAVFRTVDGRAGGTPAYFPPEVSRDGADPDERADAYSFAVMAYEVLTGKQPFVAEDPMALVAAHWAQEADPPHAFIPGFPPAASAILLAGLDKTPARRPLPRTMVDDLSAVPIADWPVVIRHATSAAATSSARPTRRVAVPGAAVRSGASTGRRRSRRRAVWLGVSALLACVVALGVTWWLLARDDAPPPLAIRSVAVTVQPVSARGRCPATRFEFVARIRLNGSRGTLKLRWTRPDGRVTPAQELAVAAGRQQVDVGLRFDVSGTNALRGQAVLHLLSPPIDDVRSASIEYRC